MSRAGSTRPHVGKHLKDHLQVGLVFPAPGRRRVDERASASRWGPTRCARLHGPLPADPADDRRSAARTAGAQSRGRAARHRVGDHRPRARLLVAVRRGGLVLHRPRRPPHPRRADRLLRLRLQPRHLAALLCASTRTSTSTTPTPRCRPDAESIIVLANPVQPHSEGEIVLAKRRPARAPRHPHELLRRSARHGGDGRGACAGRSTSWRTGRRSIGPLLVPPSLAAKHGHSRATVPSDALLEDLARHYSFTVYHLTSTCRIGSVVDPRVARGQGVQGLRVADASVMPNVVSGNTNAA